jgi:hypothetical protein
MAIKEILEPMPMIVGISVIVVWCAVDEQGMAAEAAD